MIYIILRNRVVARVSLSSYCGLGSSFYIALRKEITANDTSIRERAVVMLPPAERTRRSEVPLNRQLKLIRRHRYEDPGCGASPIIKSNQIEQN